MDVAVAVPGDPDAELLVRSLMATGYRVLASVEQDTVNRLATARLAPPGHLVALKLLARDDETRPQDAADLRALTAVAGADDLALAREAVGLVEARGHHRDRDLVAALADLRT